MGLAAFESHLSTIGFLAKNKSEENGVVLTANRKQKFLSLSAQELFALETAEKFNATAVYFRYFPDGRSCIAQAYLFDNTATQISSEELAIIHKKLWSSCAVPLYIVLDKTEVRIFDARERVKETEDVLSIEPFDSFIIAATAKAKLADLLDTGAFWETEKNRTHFNYSTSAYTDLITGLKKVYEDFLHKSNLPKHIAIRLLVQCLLIKYLEERDEEEPNGLFAKTFFKKNFQSENFCSVIRDGKLLELLDKLAKHFNGKIFEWDNESQRKFIEGASVKQLAFYLDGDNKDNHYVLWRLYSFSHLPVELISSVYEELLSEGQKDMVYTPDVVAGTLVDECMPLDKPQTDFKLIDISCGSGIFLVKAFKRIVQWWRFENRNKQTGALPHPDKDTLKQLLEKSIYGIDIQHEATLLTIFSLALAFCDELKPSEIWTNLRFKNLSESNILSDDFFNYITHEPPSDFDLVIGNAPFNPPNDKSNGDYLKELATDYQFRPSVNAPDYNIGLMMLVESFKLLKDGGQLCLIQSAGPLLYQKNIEFKKAIFEEYNLQQVIDFTLLVDKLWNKATVSTAAVFIQKAKPNNKKVAHLILHRTQTNLNKLYFEIDHYDLHYVSKHDSVYNPNVWKVNLIGGGRLVPLVNRLAGCRKLGEFLKDKENEGWRTNVGFIEKGKNKNPADYITGKNFLPTKLFLEDGINKRAIKPTQIEYFHSTGDPLIYTPPHILLKGNIGDEKLITDYSNEYLTFRDKVIGIHAPREQEQELKALYDYLLSYSDLLRSYIIATSSQLVIGMNTAVLKNDFMQCPYPANSKELKTSVLEKLLMKEAVAHFKNATQKNKLEKVKADEHHLRDFSKTFCGILNSVYKTEAKQFSLARILDAGSYYALQFNYSGSAKPVTVEMDTQWEKHFSELATDNKKPIGNVRLQRILKLYAKDKVILVKPKNLRYWLHTTAARDADETFVDYTQAGY